MKRVHWSEDIRLKAKTLRLKGFSYGQLQETLKVPKSTLHVWIHGISRKDRFTIQDRMRWAKQMQPLGSQANHRKREERIARTKQQARLQTIRLDIREEMKKAILAMLYWSEGSKVRGGMCFANTDPRLMLLFITTLRDCYSIDESKLRVRLHLHDYHNEVAVKSFWSELLHVPETQFYKTYHKARSKEKTFRRNFGGICFLRYNSEDLKDSIAEYAFALGEKVTGTVHIPALEVTHAPSTPNRELRGFVVK